MVKKIIAMLLVASACVLAQDETYVPAPTEETQYEDMSAYTSGAPAPETPVMNINEVSSSDPVFYLSVHPVTMLLWWAIFDSPYFNITFEGCIGPVFSIITHPEFLFWGDSRSTQGFSEDVSLFAFGVTEGIRYYFGAHHKGLYLEPQFIYEHLGLDYEYSGYGRENVKVSGDAFGGAVVLGYKIVSGHFTMASDVGYGYIGVSVKGESRDDVEEATAVGWGLTGNFSMGYAF